MCNEFSATSPITPNLEMVDLDSSLLSALKPVNGIVVVAGGTGSGKSTTLAAITRTHLEDINIPVKIIGVYASIKYTFEDVTNCPPSSSSIITLSEVGQHVNRFEDVVCSTQNRAANILIVDGAEDSMPILDCLNASNDCLVYVTIRADHVPGTIQRLLSTFSAEDRDAYATTLINALRFCMVQRLLPRVDNSGRNVPVREYIKFTPRLVEKLLAQPVDNWPAVLEEEVSGNVRGTGPDDMRQSFSQGVTSLRERGINLRP